MHEKNRHYCFYEFPPVPSPLSSFLFLNSPLSCTPFPFSSPFARVDLNSLKSFTTDERSHEIKQVFTLMD